MKEIPNFLNAEDFEKFYAAIPKIEFVEHTHKQKPSRVYTKNFQSEDLQVLFKLMYGCGLRVTEAVELRTSDFDLDNLELKIRTKNGVQKTTILPTDIPMLRTYLPKEDRKIFTIVRATVWLYAKAIGKKANLTLFKKTSERQVKGVFPQLFRESRRKQMHIDGCLPALVNLKLRIISEEDYGGYTLEDLKEWEEKSKYRPKRGVVVFLDALGTKGSWFKNSPHELIINWENLISKTEKYFSDISKNLKIKFSIYAFSDTVIIAATENDVETLLLETGKAIRQFFMTGIEHGFFFRGCITVGNFFESEKKTMLIGSAVDEAARYYEATEWIGIFCTPSTHSVLQRMIERSNIKEKVNQFFVRYDIPIKRGIEKNGWTIKLNPDVFISQFTDGKKHDDKTLKDFVHERLENSTDPDSSQKWKNTLEFLLYLKNL